MTIKAESNALPAEPTSASVPPEPSMPPPTTPEAIPPEELPMEPVSEGITSGGIVAMVGGLLIIIGVALPWFDVTEYGGPVFLGIQSSIWGILPLIFAIIIIVLAVAKKPLGAGILGLISLIFVILPLLILSTWLAEYGLSGFAISVFSYGWYLALVGSILAMIGGFIGHKQM